MSAGTDINLKSYADMDSFSVLNLDLEEANPTQFSDTLKVSHCTKFDFEGGFILGGKENAIDCNRMCSDGLFNRMRLAGGEQASIVVKGGCKSLVFADILITPSRSAWCDVLWDDWSDQSQEPSTGLLKNLTRTDGKPVRLVVGRWTWPKIQGGHIRRCYFLSLALGLYNVGKGILRKLKLA